ncbi:MAG: hypothetical protein KBS81_03505, partial [Spirochaetales bacterium]|nr:hypothetical protein [Candidatus Physcosoma equi]
MRKALLLLLALVFCSLSLSAGQKYYPVSSEVWKNVDALCRYAGVVGPTSVGPVTEAQLVLALERAEKRLGEDHPLVVSAYASLETDSVLFSDEAGTLSLTADFSPFLYAQTNGGDMDVEDQTPDSDWYAFSSPLRSPFASFTLSSEVENSLYARLSMALGQKTSPLGPETYWDDPLHLNFKGARFCQNYPYDAGLSIGTETLNLMVARGKLSLGEGFTGNTAIGDNYDYQEFLKGSFHTGRLGVYLSLTSFDSSHYTKAQMEDPEYLGESGMEDMYGVLVSSFSGYRQLRHSVTYEALLKDNMRFSLSFINLLDTTSSFDFRLLNPFMILHNMFNY